MDYQSIVDQFNRPCAIVSVDKRDRGVRIVCANQLFKDVSPTNAEYYDGMYYYDHMPRNPKFEDFCYHAAVLEEAGHVYAEYPTGWLDQMAIPMASRDKTTALCLFTFVLTESAELRRMSTISVNVMKFAIRTGITLASAENFREGVQSVMEGALAISGAHHSRLFLLDHKSKTFQIYSEASDEYCQHKPMDFSYELINSWSRCVGDRVAFLVSGRQDIDAIAMVLPDWAKNLRDREVTSLVLLPLRRGNEIFGYVDFVDFDIRTTAEVTDVAELITVFLAAEITNHQLMDKLEEMSTTDALTGLRNRTAMLQRTSRIQGTMCGIVNLDLNGLKAVNDTLGHEAGDRLLILAAEALKKVYYYDDIHRTGGDEFVVLMPGVSKETFDRKLERFLSAMEKNEDVSFAVGSYWTDGSVDLTTAFRLADDAMYADKEEFYKQHPERRQR